MNPDSRLVGASSHFASFSQHGILHFNNSFTYGQLIQTGISANVTPSIKSWLG